MEIIKLSAIDSTNDFLKNLVRKQAVENFTVVVAESQTKGRGQMGAVWETEGGKNLIMSMLVEGVLTSGFEIFHLNVAVALAVLNVMKAHQLPNLSIKWPNDIMSDHKKLAGILIENSFKSDSSIQSIVGIGLNVNQQSFEHLPKASSMSVVMNRDYDLDVLLHQVIFQIKKNCALIMSNQTELLWEQFHQCLFKINVPIPFEDTQHNRFMGIIQGVNSDGRLQVILEDDSIQTFGIKEIQMLY